MRNGTTIDQPAPPRQPARDLALVQHFLDDRPSEEAAEQRLRAVRRALGEGREARDLWQRVLLVGMRSRSEAMRELCTRQYLELFRGKDAQRSLHDLLSFTMEEYRDYEHVRAVLIQELLQELRRRRYSWRAETVKFMLNLRRIFQLSYAPSFVDGCIRCLFLLFQDRGQAGRASAEVLAGVAFDWIREALRHGRAPEVTETAIKRELGRQPFATVEPAFIDDVYDRLGQEVNRKRVLASLDVMHRWYREVPFTEHPDPAALREELTTLRHAGFSDLSPATARVLVANGRVVDLLVELIGRWSESPRICRAAVQVLRRLPAARRLIRDPDPSTWPSLLADFRRPERRHLLAPALDYFGEFASGISVNLERAAPEDADEKEAVTYRQRLARVNRWAGLESDLRVIESVFELIGDGHEPAADRRAALACLERIDPSDLPRLLARFAAEHPADDPLVPDVLALITRLEDWAGWDVCAHYFSLVGPGDPEEAFPHRRELIRAAAATGNCGMWRVLLPWVFEATDPEIRALAEEALRTAGYGIHVDREILDRRLRALQPEKNHAAAELRRVFEEIGKEESRKLETQKEVTNTRYGFEQEYVELKLQLTNYQSFSTGKMVDLALIDQQLEELTRKIAHLTQRKNHLEQQRDQLLARKRMLQEEQQVLNREIDRERRRERDTTKKLKRLRGENQRLERQRAQRQGELDNALSQLRSVERAQQGRIRSLSERYRGLQAERRDCVAGIDRCESRRRGLEQEARRIAGQVARLEAEGRSLSHQLSTMPADSPRRHSLQGSIRSLRAQLRDRESQLRRVRDQGHQLGREINGLQGRIRSIEDEGRSIRHNIAAAEEVVAGARSQVSAARGHVESCLREIEAVREQIYGLESALVTIRHNLQHLSAEEQRLRQVLRQLQAEEVRIEQELLPVIRSLEQAKQEYERINAQRAEEERQLRAENRKFDELSRELNATLASRQQHLDELHGRIGEIHRSLTSLAESESRWEDRMRELAGEIRDLKKRYENLMQQSEQATLEQDAIARSRSLLRRLERDRLEMDKLEYGRALTLAAETHQLLSERSQG